MNRQFQIVGSSDAYEVSEPHAIFKFERYGGRFANGYFIDENPELVYVNDEIDGPDVVDFFVVLAEIGHNEWIVWCSDTPGMDHRLRGKFHLARTYVMSSPFKGPSFIDVGYVYAPYVPYVPKS